MEKELSSSCAGSQKKDLELRELNSKLEDVLADNARIKRKSTQRFDENEALTADKTQLGEANAKLAEEKESLKAEVAKLKASLEAATVRCKSIGIDVAMMERGKIMRELKAGETGSWNLDIDVKVLEHLEDFAKKGISVDISSDPAIVTGGSAEDRSESAENEEPEWLNDEDGEGQNNEDPLSATQESCQPKVFVQLAVSKPAEIPTQDLVNHAGNPEVSEPNIDVAVGAEVGENDVGDES